MCLLRLVSRAAHRFNGQALAMLKSTTIGHQGSHKLFTDTRRKSYERKSQITAEEGYENETECWLTKESRRSIDRSMGGKQTESNLSCSSVRRPVPLLLVLTPQAPKTRIPKENQAKQAKTPRDVMMNKSIATLFVFVKCRRVVSGCSLSWIKAEPPFFCSLSLFPNPSLSRFPSSACRLTI